MKEIQLFLVPTPGTKPEFLATVQPVAPNPVALGVWDAVVGGQQDGKVVLEGYTRDGWAWKPDATGWTGVTVQSTDGRNKLPGFVEYLKERQKSAFGRFGSAGVWVVSYVQRKQPSNIKMDCRITLDLSRIPHCTLKPKLHPPPTLMQQPVASVPLATVPNTATTAGKKRGGLLGKLVGAQQRTNQHMAIATAKSTQRRVASSIGDASNATTSSAAPIESKTVQQVFAEFRQSCQDKMLDFDMSDDQVLKVPIILKDHIACLSDDERPRVTMDVLKYMIYEAAEEVNEDWVATKEPSEFMDEVVIAVYKEGAAPEEVLEELNKGELPDEIRGQQRAIQEQRARTAFQAESKQKQQLEQQAHMDDEDDDEMEVLNTKKRDRRTIEDYEREKRENATKKRGRS